MIESQTTEFKRLWKDDYLKTLCAFANSQGGSFFWGLDDVGQAKIRVYDHKLVLSNGATLPPEVPVEKLKTQHISKPFNPLIANVFYKAGLVESWGKGTNSMVTECLKQGLPEPEYNYQFQTLQVTFHQTAQETAQETTQETTQENTAARILTLLRADPRLSRKDLMQLLNKADATIKQHLGNLKRAGKIKRVGSTKSGFWQVVDEDE